MFHTIPSVTSPIVKRHKRGGSLTSRTESIDVPLPLPKNGSSPDDTGLVLQTSAEDIIAQECEEAPGDDSTTEKVSQIELYTL